MKELSKPTVQTVSKRYHDSLLFNTELGLYDTVRKNENFFIGKQWEGVEANGLPTPVFNFLKRVVLFQVATITSDNIAMQASPLASTSRYDLWDIDQVAECNQQTVQIHHLNAASWWASCGSTCATRRWMGTAACIPGLIHPLKTDRM